MNEIEILRKSVIGTTEVIDVLFEAVKRLERKVKELEDRAERSEAEGRKYVTALVPRATIKTTI